MQRVFLVEDSASIRERLVPDVVLLDVQLDQSSGFDVLRAAS